MEIFLAVIAGVLIFVIGQVVLKIWLEPMQELKNAIVDISEMLSKHEGAIMSLAAAPKEHRMIISQDMAVMSSRLSGRRELIPLFPVVKFLYGLPPQSNIQDAIGGLNAISNYVVGSHKNASILASYSAQEIRDALGLYIDPGKRLDPARKIHHLKG